tara:strand:+ start:1378 stop:1536 length:159 start_codon:yes stop_codon:yes gene_type:complete
MKKPQKHKKIVIIQSEDREKLISFMQVLKDVAGDMGLQVEDGETEMAMGMDY